MPLIVWANNTPVRTGSGLFTQSQNCCIYYRERINEPTWSLPNFDHPPGLDQEDRQLVLELYPPLSSGSQHPEHFLERRQAPCQRWRQHSRRQERLNCSRLGRTRSACIKSPSAGKKLLNRTPKGESCRQRLRKPSRGIAPFCPTQPSPCHLWTRQSLSIHGSLSPKIPLTHTLHPLSSWPFPTRWAAGQKLSLWCRHQPNHQYQSPMVMDNVAVKLPAQPLVGLRENSSPPGWMGQPTSQRFDSINNRWIGEQMGNFEWEQSQRGDSEEQCKLVPQRKEKFGDIYGRREWSEWSSYE